MSNSHSLFRPLRREFFHKKGLSETSLKRLTSLDPSLQIEFLKSLQGAQVWLVGDAFAPTFRQIKAPKSHPELNVSEAALAWSVSKVAIEGQVLLSALASQCQVENALLRGDYADCSRLESQHVTCFGLSIWQVSVRLLRRQLHQGIHGNRTELADICVESKDNSFVQYMAQSISARCQPNVSTSEWAESFGFLREYRPTHIPEYSFDYLRFRLLDRIPESPTALCNLLHFDARLPVIDRYHTIIRVLHSRIIKGDLQSKAQDVTLLRSLNDCVGDQWSRNLLALHGIEFDAQFRPDDAQVQTAAELFLLGRFREALDISSSALARDTTQFSLFQIVGASAARIGSDAPPSLFRENTVAAQLLLALFNWYSGGVDRGIAIESLRRLARALISFRIGPSILTFIDRVDETTGASAPELSVAGECGCALGANVPLPQLAWAIPSEDSGAVFAKRYATARGRTPASKAIRSFFRQSLNGLAPNLTQFPLEIRALYESKIQMSRRNWDAVLAILTPFRESDPRLYGTFPELLTVEATSLVETGQIDRAAGLLGQLYAEDPRRIPPSLLRVFAVKLADDRFRPNPHVIGWAIIAGAAFRSEPPLISADRAHDLVGDFIESHGVTTPLELLRSVEMNVELVAFFRDCCILEIMEGSIWIGSHEQLLRQRLDVCIELRTNHRVADISISREIANLTQEVAVLELTDRVEKSRIFVDWSSIRSKLEERISDQVTTLLSIRALLNNDLKRGFRLLGMPDSGQGRVLLKSVDQDVEYFRGIFDKMKQEFLFSPESGLDANLSQRVRHGKIGAALRGIFERANLITRTNSDGHYLPNISRLHEMRCPEATVELVNGIFATFSARIDQLIRDIRLERIQIRREDKPNGLFEYEFSEEELEQGVRTLPILAEHRDVYELASNFLWTRTDRNLERVRNAISGELAVALRAALDEIVESIEQLAEPSLHLGPLKVAITTCKTGLNRELSSIANWFLVEDRREQKQFQWTNLVEAVRKMLERIGKSCEVHCNFPEGKDLLPGRTFRPLWDLLLILFDNAAEHSGMSTCVIRLDADLWCDRCWMVCRNQLAAGYDTPELRQTVGQLAALSLNDEGLAKLRSEGGTGIAKLHKIVRHELAISKSTCEIIPAVTDDSWFEISISFGGRLVSDEDPSD